MDRLQTREAADKKDQQAALFVALGREETDSLRGSQLLGKRLIAGCQRTGGTSAGHFGGATLPRVAGWGQSAPKWDPGTEVTQESLSG